MLVVLSDTHRQARPGLEGSLQAAVREADQVVHAGDFTTAAVLDGFQSVARAFLGVHGNADSPAVQDRLPAARSFQVGSVRVAVTHTQRGGETGLSYFGAERDADLVIFGHTHRPAVVETGDRLLLNPGSHADPRGGEPSYAVLRETGSGLAGEIRTLEGTGIESVRVEGRSGRGEQGKTGGRG
jgi:hypothetical protein